MRAFVACEDVGEGERRRRVNGRRGVMTGQAVGRWDVRAGQAFGRRRVGAGQTEATVEARVGEEFQMIKAPM